MIRSCNCPENPPARGAQSEDLKDGASTVWTNSLKEKKSIIDPMRRFLKLEADFEKTVPRLSEDFAYNGRIPDIYKKGFKITILKGMLRHDDPQINTAWKVVGDSMPLSTITMKKIVEGLKTFSSSEKAKSCLSEVYLRLIRNFDAY